MSYANTTITSRQARTRDAMPRRNRGTAVSAVRLPREEIEASSSLQSALGECVSQTVRRYLADMGDTPCTDGLYSLVMLEVEAPLLRGVLEWHEGNQSRSAETLGINRATLRKKLTQHGVL